MKFFKKNKAKSNSIDDNKIDNSKEKNDSVRVKQNSKISLTQLKPGIGNTTNMDNSKPKRCVGCGHLLQTEDMNEPGYVKNIEMQDYCLRCFKIKYYNQLVSQEINDKDFIQILDDINKITEKIRYYYVLDIFDLPGSRVTWLEQLISKKEVVVLVNKVDLLPKQVSQTKIIKYVKNLLSDSPIKDSQVVLTSSVNKHYIYKLLELTQSIKYDQYIVGVSNTGKSSLTNALLKANFQIPSIVTSKYVNTTLDKIKINLTEENFIYDTPGLVKYHHIAVATAPTYWDYFFFKKEIKQRTYQLKPEQTIFYGGVAWFTFKKGDNEKLTSFHFWVNRQMPLHRTKALNTDDYFRKHRHELAPRLKDLTGKISFDKHVFSFNKEDENKGYDIHISGLGWINFKAYDGLEIIINVPAIAEKIGVFKLPEMINDSFIIKK